MTRLRELRQARGMMIIDLAFATRLHPSQLSSIERGRLAASKRARETLCAFFGIAESEVFDRRGLAV